MSPAKVAVIERKFDLDRSRLLVQPTHGTQVRNLVQIALCALGKGQEALQTERK